MLWFKYLLSSIQVLFSLYNTLPDFVPIMMMAEVLTALAAILFPPNCTDDIHMRKYLLLVSKRYFNVKPTMALKLVFYLKIVVESANKILHHYLKFLLLLTTYV